MVLFTLLFLYAGIELVFQISLSAKTGIVNELFEFKKKADQNHMSIEAYAFNMAYSPYLGWGQFEKKIYEVNAKTSKTSKTTTILFIGDSVTAAHGVEIGEGYVDLLHQQYKNRNIRLINLAVRGYGVDQMLMKLEFEARKYNPDLIILAFIPHDLIRPANDFLYGLPKPKYEFDANNIHLKLAGHIDSTFNRYMFAREHYQLTFFHLSRYLENRQYYVPGFFNKYYDQLYTYLSNQLKRYASSNKTPIVIVRLPNTFQFRGLSDILSLAERRFKEVDVASKDVSYIDLDLCAKERSQSRNVNFNHEFEFHPGKQGHAVIAECLAESLKAVIPKNE